MAHDREAIQLAGVLFKAMAFEQVIREQVEPIQQQVVEQLKPVCRDTAEVIIRPNDMYRAADKVFQQYMDLTREQYEAIGIQPENPDHCPLLVAEDLTRKAKQNMIDYCEQYTGIGHSDLFYDFPNDYNNYIDLTLRFFAPKVKALKEKEK